MICNGQLIAYFTCQNDQNYASFSIYWWTESHTLPKPYVKWSRPKCMTWSSRFEEIKIISSAHFSSCSNEKTTHQHSSAKTQEGRTRISLFLKGCSRVDQSVHFKHDLIFCRSHKIFLCLSGIIRHSVKFFQYLLKAVDGSFVLVFFIAPMFSRCWLCRGKSCICVSWLTAGVLNSTTDPLIST